MAIIPADMPQFLESVVAIVVATSDGSLKPEVTRGWGMRVLDDGVTVSFGIDRAPSQRTLENLRLDNRIAVACIRPDFAARQLKGRCIEIGLPTEDDAALIEQHRQFYVRVSAEYDIPEQTARRLWSDDVVELRCQIDELFDQTPGPEAGRAL